MKLLVLDKDGTLTRTKSGHTFVQHPEDQVLIDGVAEAIAAYTADGWTMAIASNQGGCQVRECKAIDFPVGAYYVNGNDKPLKVIRKNQSRERIPHSNEVDSFVMMHTAEPRPNGKDYLYFSADSIIQFQYKTIDMAIAEMQFAMKLIGLENSALFCPDKDGKECWHVHSTEKGEVRHIAHPLHKNKNCEQLIGLFRKPNEGMLTHLKSHFSISWSENRFLMIGDRDEDFGAAVNAGFGYMHVSAWLEPFVK